MINIRFIMIYNMKKLFIFLFSILILSSCRNDGTQKVTDDNGGITGGIIAKEFDFKGHYYIEFKDYGISGHGFVHDPECLKKDLKIKQL